YYGSQLLKGDITGDTGNNWLHNFEWRLHRAGNIVVVISPRAEVYQFSTDGKGNWSRQGGNGQRPLQLIEIGSDFIVFNGYEQLSYLFNSDGQLLNVRDGKGNNLVLSYETNTTRGDFGKLKKITDGYGRRLYYYYINIDGEQKLYNVETDHAGGAVEDIRLTYQAEMSSSPQSSQEPTPLSSSGSESTTAPPPSESTASSNDSHNLVRVSYSRGGPWLDYRYLTSGSMFDVGLMTAALSRGGNMPYEQSYFSRLDGEPLSGRVKTQKNARGDTFTFTYDTTGTQTIVTGPDNKTLTHTHTSEGILQQAVNEAGVTLNLAADNVRRHNAIKRSDGSETRLTFNPLNGKVDSVTNRNGEVTQFVYQSRTGESGEVYQDLVEIRFPDGTSMRHQYDDSGNLIKTTNQAGAVWQYTYDASGLRTSATTPDGAVTQFSYDSYRNLVSRTDSRGHTTAFTHDQHGRLQQITLPDGKVQNFVRDPLGLVLRETDENGNTTTHTYGDEKLLTGFSGIDGEQYTFDYDSNVRLISVKDAFADESTRSYSNRGELAAVKNREGNVTDFVYDGAGKLTEAITPLGNRWKSNYDAVGNLIAAISPEGNEVRYTYDALGQVLSITDAEGGTSQFSYDAMGRILRATSAQGRTLNYSYDALGELTEIALPGGIVGKYTRDNQGRLTEIIDPAGNSWKSQYSMHGFLEQRIDPLGRKETYSYDERGRLASVQYADGTSQQLSYYGPDRVFRRQFSDDTSLDYQYNGAGRLIAASRGVTLQYTKTSRLNYSNGINVNYLKGGRVSSLSLPDAGLINYSYDDEGVLSSISDWAGGTTNFERNTDGQITKIIFPNGIEEIHARDKNGRITLLRLERAGEVLASIQYNRDADGQIIRQEHTLPVAAQIPGDSQLSLSVDAAQQVSGFSYDARGRLLDDGSHRFGWDIASRVTSLQHKDGNIAFGYDAFGGVISRTKDKSTKTYRWNMGFEHLPAVSEISDAENTRYYVHTPEGYLLYSVNPGGERAFHHFDAMGNTILITNDSGEVTDTFQYTPYGTLLAHSGNSTTPFTWGGRYGVMREPGTSLYRTYQRLYDAATMRFISPDPIPARLHPHSINPYSFAARNPLRYQDPLGTGPVEADESSGLYDVVTLLTGAAGILDHYTSSVADGFDTLATHLGNALTSTDTPDGNKAAKAQVKNAQRLKTAKTGVKLVGQVGAGLQVLSVGNEAIKLKNSLDRTDGIYKARIDAAFENYRKQITAAQELFAEKQIPLDEFTDINRERWLLRHRDHLRQIESNLEYQLRGAQRDHENDSWLDAMIGAKGLLGTFVPVPQSWWPDVLNPENNYPGVQP
ncbi:RHS repeat-associated core domain-containing protein, partial [Litorivivens sp.]|uniref:RHS repeat-associated core domain-containing protein n=1 Tax=Litorivivens sp. TaxID=2020868 RepID=UPI003564CA4F